MYLPHEGDGPRLRGFPGPGVRDAWNSKRRGVASTSSQHRCPIFGCFARTNRRAQDPQVSFLVVLLEKKRWGFLVGLVVEFHLPGISMSPKRTPMIPTLPRANKLLKNTPRPGFDYNSVVRWIPALLVLPCWSILSHGPKR